jgi:glycosyltransferase involved in cell wall biosynthesis
VRVIAPIPWLQKLTKICQLDSGNQTRSALSRDPNSTSHPTYIFPPKIWRASYGWFYWQSIRSAVRRNCSTFHPDLVLGYWAHPDGYAALQAARGLNVPVAIISGGSDLRLLTKHVARRAAITKVLLEADRVIVLSRDLAKHAQQLGVASSRIDVIHRGVDAQCFFPRDREQARKQAAVESDTILLLWIGRFEAVKNPALLLQAAVNWKRHWGQRLSLLMVGEGSLHNSMRRLANALGIDDVVQFLGSRSPEQLATLYNAANLTVLTSRSEGIPNVLLESLACGTRFVATDVGGVSEVALPNRDWLVPSDDETALSQAVIRQTEYPSRDPETFRPRSQQEMAREFERSFRQALGMESQTPIAGPCLFPVADVPSVQALGETIR